MPELPDILLYRDALHSRIVGHPLERVTLSNPFFIRSVNPPVEAMKGRVVAGVEHVGKRFIIELASDDRQAPEEDSLFLVIHLMIAGRFRWLQRDAKPPGKIVMAVFDFPNGRLVVTEAGTKKRASLHVVQGRAALADFDRGGIDVLNADQDAFRAALRRENHTLKRSLTDPRLFCGIGNAYSDEILHAAGLSPLQLTSKMNDDQIERLYTATRETLSAWIERLAAEFRDRFPGAGDVTAFRPDFAVHGRFGQPCPSCGTAVQRIRYAENETNYCPRCQTGGKVLADRSLSRLLKNDWPRTIEELEGR
jgi:formamidopyrimidine-DNA glycosylase